MSNLELPDLCIRQPVRFVSVAWYLSMINFRMIALLSMSCLTLMILISYHHRAPLRQYLRSGADSIFAPVQQQRSNASSCTDTLRRQVALLTDTYGEILAGIRHVAIVGFPDHPNKGDSAIWSGEMILLERLGLEKSYVFRDETDYNATQMRLELERTPKSETAILFHGGGNFGDIWYWHQEVREQVVIDFPDYRIRSFPQTYRFSDKEKEAKARRVYAGHKDLQLAARDYESYNEMKQVFGAHHKIVLMPDVATMLWDHPVHMKTVPEVTFMIQARTDKEAGQDHAQDEGVFQSLMTLQNETGDSRNATIRMDDWLEIDPEGLEEHSFDDKAWMRLRVGKRFVTRGQVLITDRLHAHILSTLWGVPHIVLEEGDYGKIQRYHESWLKDVCDDRSVLVNTAKQAVAVAKSWHEEGRIWKGHSV